MNLNDLKEPRENPLVIAATKFMLPLAMKHEQLQVNVPPETVTAIRKLHKQPTCLMVNHADRYDPLVAFALSEAVGEDFWYLGARELFDKKFNGWLMQNIGAYSVVRGKPDDEASALLTRKLITDGRRKLIMFPEGDITGRDDAILPLKEDGMANLFEAQKRTGGRAVTLLPLTCNYSVRDDAQEAIDKTIADLESRLYIFEGDRSGPTKTRIWQIIETHLKKSEENFAAFSNPAMSLENRLEDFCMLVIMKFAEMYRIHMRRDEEVAVSLYDIRREMRSRELPTEFLDVLQQYLIVANTMRQSFTNNVAWRLADRMEELVTGKCTPKGHRTVVIRAGEPIDVSELSTMYETNKQKAVKVISEKIRRELQKGLVFQTRESEARNW